MNHLPLVVSFSGGRTSAYMLRRLLDEGANVLTIFANTGKERPETLDFVNECAIRWGVEVVWIEYRPVNRYEVVTYETADRTGDVFASLIDAEHRTPNVLLRNCSSRLKEKPIRRYLRDRFGDARLRLAIGIRADESRRAKYGGGRYKFYYPLAQWGVTKEAINAYWSASPFDLRIDSRAGNCDLCFMKRRSVLIELIRQDPSAANWWIEQEAKTNQPMKAPTFYKYLLALSQRPTLFEDYETESLTCFCTN